MSAAAVIATLHFRVWFNGIARAFGSRRAAGFFLGSLGCLLLAWLIYGTISLSSQMRTNMSSIVYLVKPLVAMLFVLPAVGTLFVTVYSVGSSMIGNMLAVLPIEERDRVGAVRWISVALGFVIGMLVGAPFAIQFLTPLPVWVTTVVALSCLFILIIGAAVARLLFTVFELIFSWLFGFGQQLTNAVSGVATAVLLAWSFLTALPIGRGRTGDGPLALLSVPLGWATNNAAPPWLMVPLFIGISGAVIAVIQAVDRVPRRRKGARYNLTAQISAFRPKTLIGLELRQWVRFPANGTFLTFAVILLVLALIFWSSSLDADQWWIVGYLFLALASTLGVGSFGPTRSAHWIYATVGKPLAWVLPKLSSIAILWLSSVAITFAALSALTAWKPAESLHLLATLFVELLTGSIVGIILPVNQQQSLSTAFSEMVTIGIVFAVPMALRSLPWLVSTVGFATTHAVAVVLLLGIYFLVARSNQKQGLLL